MDTVRLLPFSYRFFTLDTKLFRQGLGCRLNSRPSTRTFRCGAAFALAVRQECRRGLCERNLKFLG